MGLKASVLQNDEKRQPKQKGKKEEKSEWEILVEGFGDLAVEGLRDSDYWGSVHPGIWACGDERI